MKWAALTPAWWLSPGRESAAAEVPLKELEALSPYRGFPAQEFRDKKRSSHKM